MITRHLLLHLLLLTAAGQTVPQLNTEPRLHGEDGAGLRATSGPAEVAASNRAEGGGADTVTAGWGGGLEAEAGSVAEIPCDLPLTVVGDGSIIVWKHESRRILFAGGLRVRQDPRLSIRASGRILVLADVEPRDAGDYTCQTELEDTGDLVTASRRLVVLQPARAKITPPSGGVITVKAGTSLLLSCSGSGVPVPEVAWLRDGQVLASSPTGEADLPLKAIGWQAAGLYQCRAANNVGVSHIQNYTIHVLHAPVVEIMPVDVEQTPGDSNQDCRVQIQCLVYANPRATVRWFHNGRLLQGGQEGAGGPAVWALEYLHVLQLPDCAADREGEYSCIADNSLGSDEAVTALQPHHVRQVMTAAEELIVRVDRQISAPTSGGLTRGGPLPGWPATIAVGVLLFLLSSMGTTTTTT
jgi:hypothetical protein